MRGAAFVRLVLGVTLTGVLAATIAPPEARSAVATTPEQLLAGKSLGQRSAPILVEDFADFQCPTCKVLFQETTRKLIQEYVATGKVYLVHRDYPLHPHSRDAAKWANAAALIGKFEPVEEALYSKQDSWGATGDIEGTLATVLSAAEMKHVKALMSSEPEINKSIDSDIQLANRRGVGSTPTVFITYKGKTAGLPPGAISYALLKQYLDYLLKR